MDGSLSRVEISAIGHIKSDFPTKFGIPRQSGLCKNLLAQIVFEAPYDDPDAFRGIEEFSHLWVIWGFSENPREDFSPTVRPPKLGGNQRRGVFATRSPFRPNPLGLSCVKLERVIRTGGKIVLEVSGGDMKDGTPVYDNRLKVYINPELLELVDPQKRSALTQVLALDPRPGYQQDEDRVYGFGFAGLEIKFKVRGDTLTVTQIYKE